MWTTRLRLEWLEHREAVFVTLTLDEANLEMCRNEVRMSELLRFISWFRDVFGEPVRYFGVGEYGEQTSRAHYHCILFGVPVTARSMVEQVWGKGSTQTLELSDQLISYIAGYVSKKWTKKTPDGRPKEAARMSKDPGIGAYVGDKIGKKIPPHVLAKRLREIGDIPTEVRIGGKILPVGRYIAGRMRVAAGLEKTVPMEKRLADITAYNNLSDEDLRIRENRRTAGYERALQKVKHSKRKRHL